MYIIKSLLIFLIFIAPLSVLLHEIGHLIGAIIVKADNIILSIGQGKKIKTIRFKKLLIHIHMFFFISGQAQNKRDNPYTSSEILIITISGPIVNLFFALFFYYLIQSYSSYYITLFFLFNLWLGVINLIPFKLRGKYSDGFIILETLLKSR